MSGDVVCECVARIGATRSGACFSADGRFRYSLWRMHEADLFTPAEDGGLALVVMLNPSTAGAAMDDNDPTVGRVVDLTRDAGHNGVIVANAFALRSTDPKALMPDPRGAVGPEIDAHLRALAAAPSVRRVIAAWGANVENSVLRFRVAELRAALGERVEAWAVTAGGSPGHPLYLPGETRPSPYAWPEQAARERTVTATRRNP